MLRRRRSGPSQLRAGLLAATVLVAVGSVACGSRDDQIPSTPERTTESSTTTASVTSTAPDSTTPESGDLIPRYEAFWAARFEANQAPVNPDHPGLREFATGSQLANVIEETTRRRDEGLALRRPDKSVARRSITIVSNDGHQASLQDCAVNDGVVYRVASGEIVDDSVVTLSIEATLERIDGQWKVATTQLIQQWEGVAGCALSE